MSTALEYLTNTKKRYGTLRKATEVAKFFTLHYENGIVIKYSIMHHETSWEIVSKLVFGARSTTKNYIRA